MTWIGTWGNQYGSVVEITSDTDRKIVGTFRTALSDSGFMETLWYVVADAALSAASEGDPAEVKKLHWWRAITTSADTFERFS
ncbi:MAG: hypothetical protein ACJ8DC_14295 [Gemmatimonadales bacterium]